MVDHWILDRHGEPQRTDDFMGWARWYETAERTVQVTRMGDPEGEVVVSTVFLGVDHNSENGPEPVLWESLVRGGPLDNELRRYTSREAAVQGHDELVADVIDALAKGRE
jgi:hypothetical protein